MNTESRYPGLLNLARKVARVHGGRHPQLIELAAAVENTAQSVAPSEARRRLGYIRTLASDFLPPEDACNSYRALFSGLRAYETDVLAELPRETASGPDAESARPGQAEGHPASCCGA